MPPIYCHRYPESDLSGSNENSGILTLGGDYFDDAVKSQGDVAVLRNWEQVRLDKREWSEIEKFFKSLVLDR